MTKQAMRKRLKDVSNEEMKKRLEDIISKEEVRKRLKDIISKGGNEGKARVYE